MGMLIGRYPPNNRKYSTPDGSDSAINLSNNIVNPFNFQSRNKALVHTKQVPLQFVLKQRQLVTIFLVGLGFVPSSDAASGCASDLNASGRRTQRVDRAPPGNSTGYLNYIDC